MKILATATIIALSVSTAYAASMPTWQRKALKEIKAEKKVLDAKWRMPESNVLWVAMQPDGSDRNGFAEYLCMVLTDSGAPEGALKTVFIYDPRAYEGGGDAMGMAACR